MRFGLETWGPAAIVAEARREGRAGGVVIAAGNYAVNQPSITGSWPLHQISRFAHEVNLGYREQAYQAHPAAPGKRGNPRNAESGHSSFLQ